MWCHFHCCLLIAVLVAVRAAALFLDRKQTIQVICVSAMRDVVAEYDLWKLERVVQSCDTSGKDKEDSHGCLRLPKNLIIGL